MSQVVQLEKAAFGNTSETYERDTWIFELPVDVCRREGYPKGTMVSMTVRNGGVLTTIIHPSAEVDQFVERLVKEDREFFEEMKRIGD